MSQKEALELQMMEENVCFDESIGNWRVRYPFLQDPEILSTGVNICPKMGKPFPNADFQNHKLFPKYDA